MESFKIYTILEINIENKLKFLCIFIIIFYFLVKYEEEKIYNIKILLKKVKFKMYIYNNKFYKKFSFNNQYKKFS